MAHHAGQSRALLADPALAAVHAVAKYPDGLSPREVEVLQLLAAGKSNPEIATALVISLYTVYRHVNHILAKTGCSNRVAAATYAYRHGIAS
jgi:DNA-binding NarL/FixJ family response regulator